MNKNICNAVNIYLLKSPATHPGRFESGIPDPAGNMVGYWIAHRCDNLNGLFPHLPPIEESIAKLESQHPEIWPLAVLNWIEVNEEHWRKGFGSAGLADFRKKAAKHGCRVAILKVGWSDSSPMEDNLSFYRKNGWQELFECGTEGLPIGEPISYHDLAHGFSMTRAI